MFGAALLASALIPKGTAPSRWVDCVDKSVETDESCARVGRTLVADVLLTASCTEAGTADGDALFAEDPGMFGCGGEGTVHATILYTQDMKVFT